MCGIVGIISHVNVVPRLIEGLTRLEYRGYDSAGIAVVTPTGLERCRAQGKIVALEAALVQHPLSGIIGIGHTRWATHGAPSVPNAHPHMSDRVAVVHNGIIENYRDLQVSLIRKGYSFESETDTEVIVHLVEDFLSQGLSPQEAAARTFGELRGAYALALIFSPTVGAEEPILIGARRGSPLAIGYGDGEMFLGSDAMALGPFTQKLTYLEEGDWAVLTRDGVQLFDIHQHPVERPIKISALAGTVTAKGPYRHFMLKEIHDQPSVLADVLQAYAPGTAIRDLRVLEGISLKEKETLYIVACGTSFYAGCVAKYWLERWARVTVHVEIASEFRYREPPLPKGGLALFISQSGETADTLAALRYAKSQGQTILTLVNAPESSMAREADHVYELHAGPEIGVASTKAFTAQLMILALMGIRWGNDRGHLSEIEGQEILRELRDVPARINSIINAPEIFQKLAIQLARAVTVLYLGRGSLVPIAFEGALKLKELSYIHAEGFAGGELKHGPIALIDDKTLIIYLMPSDSLREKNISNVQEILARKGRVILLTDTAFSGNQEGLQDVILPPTEAFSAPILYSVPLQMIAYYTAVEKGTDVDQPRNLAKSVTVE